MSIDGCNGSFCKNTTEIFYLVVWWSVKLGSGQENQGKCKQWQKAFRSSHLHQLCGVFSTSSSGPPIDLWKTILHKLNLNRFLGTIFLKTTFMLQAWLKGGLPSSCLWISFRQKIDEILKIMCVGSQNDGKGCYHVLCCSLKKSLVCFCSLLELWHLSYFCVPCQRFLLHILSSNGLYHVKSLGYIITKCELDLCKCFFFLFLHQYRYISVSMEHWNRMENLSGSPGSQESTLDTCPLLGCSVVRKRTMESWTGSRDAKEMLFL